MEHEIRRCVVYTRKSTDEGLEQPFNSLDAQREAGEAYILSQKAQGWRLLPDRYDDGGFSGGDLNRPGLKRLLADIKAGKIDVVVVYKIDRLSRSLCDFAELSKAFDRYGVAFCSVTQEINTTTSSGRMMLNILMTFAQYEREVIAERIRDKMAASRKRGKWVGGSIPLGYEVKDKRLIVNPEEAEIVRRIFQRFDETHSPKQIVLELTEDQVPHRGRAAWGLKLIYNILKNHTYVGEVEYKGVVYPGEHEGIIDRDLWKKVQQRLMEHDPLRYLRVKKQETVAMLKGVVRCGHCGGPLSPVYAKKENKRYLYYVCAKNQNTPTPTCPVNRVSAPLLEDMVLVQIQKILKTDVAQDLLVGAGLDRETLKKYADDFYKVWDEIFPVERQRIINLLLEQVVVYDDHVDIEVKANGLNQLGGELTNGND